MVATPCYGGLVHEKYLRGITSLVAEASSAGIPLNLATISNESLITRGRNELVKYFLLSECEYLFFIDSDIAFTATDVIRLVSHQKDLVVASYPLKGQRWSNISESNMPKTVDEVRRAITEHVVNFKFASKENAEKGVVDIVDGLVEINDGGTGFMCIKRSVIEKMIEAYPETEYVKESALLINENDDKRRWALFDTGIDDGKRYLSEDYMFCRRWQKLGGKVWLDPEVILTHMGTYAFEGQKFFKHTAASAQQID